jgi:cytochrome c-type biogenesis protein CcmH
MRGFITSSVLVFLFLACLPSLATEDMLQFESTEQEQIYRELIKELRCPKCQNQNIADSNAVVAKDMRVKTKELVEQGQDKQEVIDYMVNRYGQFAHYKPPINIATLMLWLGPLGFIFIALFFILRRGNKASNETISQTQAEDKQLDKELEQLLATARDKENK